MNKATAGSLLEIAVEIRRGPIRLARRLRVERPAEALSANKVSVLGYLHHHGPDTPGCIAQADHQHPQSLTRLLAELERDHLVVRSRSKEDGRQFVIEITQKGFRALSRDLAERDRWLATALAGLSEAEIQVLRIAGTLMDKIADAIPEDATTVPRTIEEKE